MNAYEIPKEAGKILYQTGTGVQGFWVLHLVIWIICVFVGWQFGSILAGIIGAGLITLLEISFEGKRYYTRIILTERYIVFQRSKWIIGKSKKFKNSKIEFLRLKSNIRFYKLELGFQDRKYNFWFGEMYGNDLQNLIDRFKELRNQIKVKKSS